MEKLSNRLLSWASIIDEKTLDQARTASGMPFIHPHLALMPDAHLGKGRPSGLSSRRSGRSCRPPSASTSDAA